MQIADFEKDLAGLLSTKEKLVAAMNQLAGQEAYIRAAIAKMQADEAAAEPVEKPATAVEKDAPDATCVESE